MQNPNRVEAHFINRNDNVPYIRVYKNFRTFRAAYIRIQSKAKFVSALDYGNFRAIYPKDLLNA